MSRGKRFESARRLSFFLLICRQNSDSCLYSIFCKVVSDSNAQRNEPIQSKLKDGII